MRDDERQHTAVDFLEQLVAHYRQACCACGSMETVRLALLTRCSSRQRLIFFCLFPNVALAFSDIGDVVAENDAAVNVDRIRSPKGKNSFTTVGLMLGLTRERVRQLH